METRWLYTTSLNFPKLVEESKQTCIIPVGSVEKHGYHLPVGMDMLHISYLAHMASQLETVCIAPDFFFGDVPGAQPAGSMTFDMSLVMDMMENYCDQIGNQGFTKILLLNGHGGNGAWLHLFQRRLENKKKPYIVIRSGAHYPAPFEMGKIIQKEGYDAFPEMTKEDCDYIVKCREDKMYGGHAGLDETSYMMGICPESVHLETLGMLDGHSTHMAYYLNDAGLFLIDDGWEINHPNFYCGDDPVGCNERIGKAALRMESQRLAKVFKLLKDDENIVKWHKERLEKLK